VAVAIEHAITAARLTRPAMTYVRGQLAAA
jgi:hypothetical protein